MKHHLNHHDERYPERLTPTRGRSSMLVHFRKRIDKNLLNQVNKKMVKNFTEKTEEEEIKKKEEAEDGEIKNRGKLILHGTCAPADITYPFGPRNIKSS